MFTLKVNPGVVTVSGKMGKWESGKLRLFLPLSHSLTHPLTHSP